MDRPGIALPMTTAILTVLYPEKFTVYDVRACDALDGFHNIGNRTNPVRIWEGYEEFREAVRRATPSCFSLPQLPNLLHLLGTSRRVRAGQFAMAAR